MAFDAGRYRFPFAVFESKPVVNNDYLCSASIIVASFADFRYEPMGWDRRYVGHILSLFFFFFFFFFFGCFLTLAGCGVVWLFTAWHAVKTLKVPLPYLSQPRNFGCGIFWGGVVFGN